MISFWLEHLPDLLDGLLVSVQLFAVSTIAGVALGFGLAVLSVSRVRSLQLLTIALVEIGRGIPILIMLQFVYFGLPSAGIHLEAMPAAWLALAVTTACYSSEIIRGGFESIGADQREAARAIGLSRRDTLWSVIVPQGCMVSLAPLAGFCLQMFQATSLAYALSIPELLSKAYHVGSVTFRYLEILSLAGILYALVGLPMLLAVSGIENRLASGFGIGIGRKGQAAPRTP